MKESHMKESHMKRSHMKELHMKESHMKKSHMKESHMKDFIDQIIYENKFNILHQIISRSNILHLKLTL